ncbi:hypothetical protein ADICYQ_2678 [Cyclobacterium qasimii M12-11B]|uniref:Uncharacterized protein n=1 Tax=Cyclobacterium qasimii M12-11B TaxID=641524 RepID=S7WW24_9BACT|nr:hypothetical protein ADICYQ_2678 [Cyclobacterium qasimii M12-11B]
MSFIKFSSKLIFKINLKDHLIHLIYRFNKLMEGAFFG